MSANTSNEERTADRSISQDPEFDDALCVPESLEITLNENDGSADMQSTEDTDTGGKFLIIRLVPDVWYSH